jgi:phage anti-repressor protein
MSFKDFIKQFGIIDEQFIDTFFENFNKYDIEEQDDFIIDLDILISWLELNNKKKEKVITKIKKEYSIDEDYIVKKENDSNRKSGHKISKYYITIELAKKLMQASNTKKGAAARNYFIEIEYILRKYYVHIIYSLQQKINQINSSKTPTINPKAGLIYIIQVPNEKKLFKIGKTTDLKKRLISHNCSLVKDLIVEFTHETENLDNVDTCIKNVFKPLRYRTDREIFEVDILTIKKWTRRCSNFYKSAMKDINKNVLNLPPLNSRIDNNVNNMVNKMDSGGKFFVVIDKTGKKTLDEIKEEAYRMYNEMYGSDCDSQDIEDDVDQNKINNQNGGSKVNDMRNKYLVVKKQYINLKRNIIDQ